MGNTLFFFRVGREPLAGAVGPLTRAVREESESEDPLALLRAIPTVIEDEGFDSIAYWPQWLDAVLRAYGDLSLLGFLLYAPSRADVTAHLARVPTELQPIARSSNAWLLTPEELVAVNAALQRARADDFSKLPPEARGYEDVEAIKPAQDADTFGLWVTQGLGGELELSEYPEARGPPARFSRRSTATHSRWSDPGYVVKWVLLAGAIGLAFEIFVLR